MAANNTGGNNNNAWKGVYIRFFHNNWYVVNLFITGLVTYGNVNKAASFPTKPTLDELRAIAASRLNISTNDTSLTYKNNAGISITMVQSFIAIPQTILSFLF